MYKIHDEKGSVQDLTTMQVITNMDSRRGRQYQAWLDKGNKPLPMDIPEVTADPRIALIDGAETVDDMKTVLKELLGLHI